MKSGNLNFLEPSGPLQACNGTGLHLLREIHKKYKGPPFKTTIFILLTYLLTPWCRVLLEKLTGLQLVKKFSAFHGTRRIITTLTSVRHLSLTWASPIQSIYPHPTAWRSTLILSDHLRLGLPSGFHTRHMPSPFHSSRFYHPHKGAQII